MNLEIYIPSNPLRQFVKSIVCYEGYSAESKYELVLPDGNAQLIIALDDNSRFASQSMLDSQHFMSFDNSWISGMQTAPLAYKSEKNGTTISVQFENGGLHSLFNIPADEFKNRVIDAALFIPNEFTILREKILTKASLLGKIAAMEAYLENRMVEISSEVELASHVIEQMCSHNNTLGKVVDQVGYSQKHVIKLFKEQIGITPKQYQKIFRFNKALELINSSKDSSYGDIVYRCNYYDQAHFINDFHNLSLKSPTEYRKVNKDYNHILPLNSLR